ncbi:hypothetical protein [Actinopolymorpha pittospori]
MRLENLRDPPTALVDGLRMRAAFGDRARLVTGHGPAHDTYCPARSS